MAALKLLKIMFLFVLFITLQSCKQQQARMPISRSSGTFMKESVERNKKIIAGEERIIDSIIKSNPKIKYYASKKGYWYKYEEKNEEASPTPVRGDIAFFDYEIKTILNQLIYSKEETKPQKYYVDKENIMMGLRDGIKLMKKGETSTSDLF